MKRFTYRNRNKNKNKKDSHILIKIRIHNPNVRLAKDGAFNTLIEFYLAPKVPHMSIN